MEIVVPGVVVNHGVSESRTSEDLPSVSAGTRCRVPARQLDCKGQSKCKLDVLISGMRSDS